MSKNSIPISNGSSTIDVEQIMNDIRARIRDSASGGRSRLPQYRPKENQHFGDASNAIIGSEELRYLNSNWNRWAVPEEITSHRRLIGPILVKCKSKIRSFIWNALLKTYFEREREFQGNLVRYLNNSARYIDTQDMELFWHLVNKVDSDVSAVGDRSDRLCDQLRATHAAEIEELRKKIDELSEPEGGKRANQSE